MIEAIARRVTRRDDVIDERGLLLLPLDQILIRRGDGIVRKGRESMAARNRLTIEIGVGMIVDESEVEVQTIDTQAIDPNITFHHLTITQNSNIFIGYYPTFVSVSYQTRYQSSTSKRASSKMSSNHNNPVPKPS